MARMPAHVVVLPDEHSALCVYRIDPPKEQEEGGRLMEEAAKQVEVPLVYVEAAAVVAPPEPDRD